MPKQHTQNTKDKIRQSLLGHSVSKNIRLKISQKLKGHKNSPEAIEKIRESTIKMWQNPNIKALIISKLKGHPNYNLTVSEETKKKISESARGRIKSEGTRLKLSEAHKGNKSRFWKGGISEINERIRRSVEYKLWRESVYKRDNWTCQKCKEKGGKLVADHIKSFAEYPELRFELSNGRTLCVDCHKQTENYGIKNVRLIGNKAKKVV